MGRLLAIDIGQKRIGLAVTDPLRLIATPLDTVHIKDVWVFLQSYFSENEVDQVIAGHPLQPDGTPSDAMRFVDAFLGRFRKLFPGIHVIRYDERYTSLIAQKSIREAAPKMKTRRDKALVDRISATILLQSFMDADTSQITKLKK